MPVGHEESQRGWRGTLGHIVQHLRDDWPAAIFVACLFAVLDNWVGWLDAINGYGFVAIGNAAGVPTVGSDAKVKAVTVVIDQAAGETRYLDRSPLDRCQLRDDLRAVYSAMRNRQADLLVVDLDLSPARWLLTEDGRTTREATECQPELYQLIKEAASSSPTIRTVLMEPIQAVDPLLLKEQKRWRCDMEQSGVTFGDGVLPVKYGLVIKQYCRPDSLAGAAYTLAAKRNGVEPTNNQCAESRYIDPRKYLPPGVMPLAVGSSETLKARVENLLTVEHAKADGRATGVQAVFFGSAFGQGDTFLTPLGELYGVEIHAAGFLSFLDPIKVNHLAELMIDIIFGFFFAFLIAYYWSRYFKLRLSEDSDDRLKAPFSLFLLGLAVAGSTVILTLGSWYLLADFGLWLSPIPMAVGMLIESFVSGAVAQGIREADALKGQGRPSRQSFRESVRKFFGDDIFLLARKGKRLSAALLALRLGIWTAVVAGALVLALLPH